MIDAFGAYGYNGELRPILSMSYSNRLTNGWLLQPGPFRKTCELTLGLLRQNEDSLMTILETFLHDPTTDFIGKKVFASPLVFPFIDTTH